MELWIEGSIEQVVEVVNSGLATTIATNPSIIAKWTTRGQTMDEVVTEVCQQVEVPVYVQLHGPSVEDFRHEMDALHKISDQIHPKLIATQEGIIATRHFVGEGLKPLVTTVSTVSQAFMAATAGAAYIAPYVGRIVDAGVDAYDLIADIAKLYVQNGIKTQIAAASIRTPQQAEESLLAGAPIVVMQYEVFAQIFDSALTQNWIDRFEEDWARFAFAGRQDQ